MLTSFKLSRRLAVLLSAILPVVISVIFSVKAHAELATVDMSVSFELYEPDLNLVFPDSQLKAVTEKERAALKSSTTRYVGIPVCHSLICNQNVAPLDLPILPVIEQQEYILLDELETDDMYPNSDFPISCQQLNQTYGMRTKQCH